MCGGKAAAGEAGSVRQAHFTVVSHLSCQKSWSGSLSRYLRHSHDAAFPVEDGKQMTYSCTGFCASESENVFIRHQIETARWKSQKLQLL